MERRKIMALGQSSRVVTLPKAWLKRNNIDQGDWVSVFMQSNGTLLIHPVMETEKKERSIQLKIGAFESEDSIIRKIISAYLNGFSILNLRSEKIFTVDQQRAIRRIVGVLYMMIIESEASSIVLEVLIDEAKAALSSGVERIHFITSSMCRDTLIALKSMDKDLAMSVISLENDVDQLMFLLVRLIRSASLDLSLGRQLGLDTLDCLDYQNLVQYIERVADNTENIAKSLVNLIDINLMISEGVFKALIKAAEIAFSNYNLAVRCFLASDIEPANEIIDKERIINGLYMELTPIPTIGNELDTSIISNLIVIRESIRRISQFASDIAEITLSRAYKNMK